MSSENLGDRVMVDILNLRNLGFGYKNNRAVARNSSTCAAELM